MRTLHGPGPPDAVRGAVMNRGRSTQCTEPPRTGAARRDARNLHELGPLGAVRGASRTGPARHSVRSRYEAGPLGAVYGAVMKRVRSAQCAEPSRSGPA